MFWAMFNDMMQRLVTFNKLEQRRKIARRISAVPLCKDAKALDFGCGTALFAPTIMGLGLRYHGFDIDDSLLRYARRLYANGVFTSSRAELAAAGPYDLIMANCCFHHISDADLDAELAMLKGLLTPGGSFLMIDILLHDDDPSLLRHWFRKLERGAYVRTSADYRKLVERHFSITRADLDRSHVFSLQFNPVYNNLVAFECRNSYQAAA